MGDTTPDIKTPPTSLHDPTDLSVGDVRDVAKPENESAKSDVRLKTPQVEAMIAETVLALVTCNDRKAAAARLGLSEDGLYWRMRNWPEVRQRCAEIPKDALARLQAGSILAADKLLAKLADRNDALEAAKEILDRVGIVGARPQTLIQNNVTGDMKLEFSE
jgi:hypothetical protein